MKIKLLFTVSIFCVISSFAQFGSQQIISTTTVKPYLSIPFDIDNDGYIDILTASLEGHKMSWYRNLDGQGNFGPEITLNETPVYYLSVDFVDLDNDGDKDILYLSNNPSYIAWLENLGAGSFGPEQIIIEENYISTVIPTDMDNDGDLDLVAAISDTYTSWIVWYENLDGQGTFGEETMLIQNNIEYNKILLEDIDNDGKQDLFATDFVLWGGSISWYKNLGNNNFSDAQLIYQFDYLQSGGTNIVDIKYVDINTNGKNDLVITAEEDTGVNTYWFENIDNSGSFGPIQYIGDLEYNYQFNDLDNDGDLDILKWSSQGNSIFWKENEDALGNFGPSQLVTSNAIFIKDAKAADLNGDGWLDIMSASLSDNKIAWYENNTLEISKNETFNIKIYPNPTNGMLNVKAEKAISKISVYNILGQRIEVTSENDQIDLSNADSGVYLLKIEDENGNSQTFKILKK